MARLDIAFHVVILLLFPSVFWAANPFTPPIDAQIFNQIIYPDTTQTSIKYKMYMKRDQKYIALLNSSFVSAGDQFDGMKVMSVNADRVILLSSSGEKRVVVIESIRSRVEILREVLQEENKTAG